MEALRAVLPDPSFGGLIFHQKLVIEKSERFLGGRAYFAENPTNVPVHEMGRRKRWWAHTLWGKSYTQVLSF